MANVKISSLPAAGSVAGADLVPIVQGGVTKRASITQVAATIGGGVSSVGASAPLASSGGANPTISLSGAVPVANGGNGLTSTPTNGQIDIGNGSGFTRTTLTAGTNVTITNAPGAITISATAGGGGVSSVTASSPLASSGGSNPNISLTGTVGIANGGNGLTSTPANGAIDIGNGSGFTRTTLTAGSNITITNGAGSITIASTAAGGGSAPDFIIQSYGII